MKRRALALLAVTVLVALAGCNGLLGGNQTATPDNNSTSGAAVHDLPLSGEDVLSTHASALNETGSFVYHQNTSARLADGEGRFVNFKNVTAPTNVSADRIFSQEQVALQPSRETYSDGEGTVYQRQENATTTAYAQFDEEAANTSIYVRPPLDGYFGGLNFTKADTTTIDGATADVYTVTDTSQLTPEEHEIGGFNSSNYESINVTIAIDRDGIIRVFEYHTVSSNDQRSDLRFDLSIRYTGIGTTDVPEPDWLPEARNATS